ncbi:MAG: hypothetical protein KC933_30970 [Myxococcales bacterium]|nr:hypothetical protein [Myxococcales bacterium]
MSCGTCGPGRCEAGACVGDGGGSAPRILSLNVNSNNLTPGDDLVVTAIVTDPDGIDDLIGGELVHPAGGSYGAFATAAQEGSYTLTLTWAQLDAVVPIRGDAQRIDQHVRTLQARFFDVAGHMVTQEVSVTFSCDVAGRGLCGTGCADFQTNPFHCGECGRRCDSFGGNYYGDATGNFCQEGLCNVVRSTDASDSRSCDQICADVGLQCEPSFQSWANVQNCARQGVGCTGRFVPEGQFCEFQGMSCGCRG